MTDKKYLVFDMDGTIADLYGVKGWLDDLHAENTRPYDEAAPIYNMNTLNDLIEAFKLDGWTIVVTTWLAMDASKEYDNAVRNSKKAWLDKYQFPYDEIHLVKYGTTKADCTRKKGGYQVLVDDNKKIRDGWNLGGTIDATKNLLKELTDLLLAEVA